MTDIKFDYSKLPEGSELREFCERFDLYGEEDELVVDSSEIADVAMESGTKVMGSFRDASTDFGRKCEDYSNACYEKWDTQKLMQEAPDALKPLIRFYEGVRCSINSVYTKAHKGGFVVAGIEMAGQDGELKVTIGDPFLGSKETFDVTIAGGMNCYGDTSLDEAIAKKVGVRAKHDVVKTGLANVQRALVDAGFEVHVCKMNGDHLDLQLSHPTKPALFSDQQHIPIDLKDPQASFEKIYKAIPGDMGLASEYKQPSIFQRSELIDYKVKLQDQMQKQITSMQDHGALPKGNAFTVEVTAPGLVVVRFRRPVERPIEHYLGEAYRRAEKSTSYAKVSQVQVHPRRDEKTFEIELTEVRDYNPLERLERLQRRADRQR